MTGKYALCPLMVGTPLISPVARSIVSPGGKSTASNDTGWLSAVI
jgi:hypothetical protein